jgi:hypothetical protein
MDEMIVTAAEAQARADAMLDRLRFPDGALTIRSIVEPDLQAGDVVKIRRGDGPEELFVVDEPRYRGGLLSRLPNP